MCLPEGSCSVEATQVPPHDDRRDPSQEPGVRKAGGFAPGSDSVQACALLFWEELIDPEGQWLPQTLLLEPWASGEREILPVVARPSKGARCMSPSVYPEPSGEGRGGLCRGRVERRLQGRQGLSGGSFPRHGERNRMGCLKLEHGSNFGILSRCVQPSSNSFQRRQPLSRSWCPGMSQSHDWGREAQSPLGPCASGRLSCWIARKVKCPLGQAVG